MRWVFKFLSACVLLSLVGAFTLADSYDADYLTVKAKRLECVMDYHAKVLSIAASNVDFSLSQKAANMSALKTELVATAGTGDHKAYQKLFMQLKSDARNSDDSLKQARAKAKDLPQATKDSIMAERARIKAEFVECKMSANYMGAKKKAEYYSKMLYRARKEAGRLSEKGVETAELNAIADEAEAAIVVPLKNATAKGVPRANSMKAFRNYCLWSGCRDGINYHFSAKFGIAKLSSVTAAIEQKANSAGLSNEIGSVRAHLASAKSELEKVGTGSYTKEQSEEVWKHINLAHKELKEILAKINKGGA